MANAARIGMLVQRRAQARRASDLRERLSDGHDITAVLVERGDGSCTVMWAGSWRSFSSRSEQWPTREAAMRAVAKVTGEILMWNELAPQTWSARAA